ncbi:MAG: methyl-accepting chemotaxis protein, partial [Deltaproteobacteria bacterium]|nr:methyl-accepting chemotaxis protein [Deltaproteobacteria bacterium]
MANLASPPKGDERQELETQEPETRDAEHSVIDMERQRRLAKERAKKKAESRTAAKRQQASERIAAAAEELASGVAEANAAAEQLNKAMEQISSGATEASAASQQSRAAAEALSRASETSSAGAQQSLRRVDLLQKRIQETSADIEKLIVNVRAAAEKNMESAKMIGELEKQADEIGQVVKTVAGIADQTNLLALNAAIEAARAGEHGRGFAVVADEVRNLAEGAEKSARNIRDLVAEIQKDVKTVAQDTEEAGTKAQEEVEKGKNITQQLVNIESEMKAVQEGCDQV